MNDLPMGELMKPKYGNIILLCEKLGYGSKDKGDSRYHIKLRNKVIEHRRDFIASSMIQGVNFPLHYDDVVVQRCATEFLQKNSEMFAQEEGCIGSTSYPSVRDSQVRDDLARMMCVQEYNVLKNARKPEDGTEGQPPRGHDDSEDDIDEAGEPGEAAPNDEEWDVPDSTTEPAGTVSPVMNGTKDPLQETVTREKKLAMKRHFCNVYPKRPKKYGNKTGIDRIEELKRSRQCPKYLRPELFRYLHNHSLYNTTRPEDCTAIEGLAKYLMKLLGGDLTTLDGQLYKKCEKLVKNSAKTLEKRSYLVKQDGILQRTRAFEMARHERYLKLQTHADGSNDVFNPRVSFEAPPTEERRKKRPRTVSNPNLSRDSLSAGSRGQDGVYEDNVASSSSGSSVPQETRNYKRQKSFGALQSGAFQYPRTMIDLTGETTASVGLTENPNSCQNEAPTDISTETFHAPIANMMPTVVNDEHFITPATEAPHRNASIHADPAQPHRSGSIQGDEQDIHHRAHALPAFHDGLPARLPQTGPAQRELRNDLYSSTDSPLLSDMDNEKDSFGFLRHYGVTFTDRSVRLPVHPQSQAEAPGRLPNHSQTQQHLQPIIQGTQSATQQPRASPVFESVVEPTAHGESRSDSQEAIQTISRPAVTPLQAQPQATFTHQPQDQLPARQFLFVLYGPTGAPDRVNRITFEEVMKWDLAQFFSNISARQPEVYQSVEYVILRCDFLIVAKTTDNREIRQEYRIDRNMSDHDWKHEKRNIGTDFYDAEENDKDEFIFQVYVKAPR